MSRAVYVFIVLAILLPEVSCNEVNDYLRKPETNTLVETLHSTVITGYTANLAMNVIEGNSFPNVKISRSNQGFPCSALIEVDLSDESTPYYAKKRANAVTVAGIWADESTAVLTMLFTDYHTESSTLDLIGIETIPVIREGENTQVVLASMDISLNPDKESILSLNLTTLEIESELLRLDAVRPEDVYVAVKQDAYFVDVNNKGTYMNTEDDNYTITGGGQLIEVAGASAEITQQALIDVKVSAECNSTPLDGMALVRTIGVKDEGFPELGTALLECPSACNGFARVIVATGMYICSNGQEISFSL
ncbi:MAG TPA: hypothetical protein PLR88_03305 [Bacteroidales bacterium]|mgnify:CR=1 FL=1|nr:hypothetical protein [Bacteroidales bacterium]HPT20951.1 hypothetical protein [Bacteroidales bacterium]